MLFLGSLTKVSTQLYKNTTGADVTINLMSFVNTDPKVNALVSLYVSNDDGITNIPICIPDGQLVAYTAPYINANEITLADGDSIYGLSTTTNVKGVISKKLISSGGGGSGIVESLIAGTGISIDSTDPANPIVTNTLILTPWASDIDAAGFKLLNADQLQCVGGSGITSYSADEINCPSGNSIFYLSANSSFGINNGEAFGSGGENINLVSQNGSVILSANGGNNLFDLCAPFTGSIRLDDVLGNGMTFNSPAQITMNGTTLQITGSLDISDGGMFGTVVGGVTAFNGDFTLASGDVVHVNRGFVMGFN